jgi:hypothetical protein
MKTYILSPALVADNWHILKGYLKEALDHSVNETPLEEWLKRILSYQAQLWISVNEQEKLLGVGITQFIQYTTHKTLHIVAVGGEGLLERISEAYYPIENFARENDCKAVEQWGRRGWGKVLSSMDPEFKTIYHVMRKEL